MIFTAERELRFGDCDLSGIAYFPAYLNILVTVIEDFFAAGGIAWPDLMKNRQISVPTAQLNVEFKRPGFYGDRLSFELTVAKIGRSSATLIHRVSARGELLWQAKQIIVAASCDVPRPVSWPDDIRQWFTKYLENTDAHNS